MNIEEKLKKLLKEYTFDYCENNIDGVMCLLDTEKDMQKMYDYIIDNDIKNTDDIYLYGFKLAGMDDAIQLYYDAKASEK